MGSPAADLAATRATGLAAFLVEGLARGLAALGAGVAGGLAVGSSSCGKHNLGRHNTAPPGGATTTGPDATTPPSYLSKLAEGGGLGQGGGGVGGYWQLGRGAGAARDPLLPHAYLKGVCVCLGAWEYRGMYAMIAISRLCREESLTSPPLRKHAESQQNDGNMGSCA